ncbi:unnamed protein product [Rangifer tarandus platyrhynchus]|uniref:Uncharacterized protein n=1 Tax=Rangifer tarandus platyrhynchus TaxID=3082113 RepID=A0AC59Z2D2_RANTA
MILLARLRQVFLPAWNGSCVACESKELWKVSSSGGLRGRPSCLGGRSRGVTSPCPGTAFPGEVTLACVGTVISWMRVVSSVAATLDTKGRLYAAAAAAAAKLLQSCPTLCDPTDGSPPGSPSLGFSRQEHWSGLPFPSPMHACMLSRFIHVRLYATLWTAAHQAPLSTGFSRQEYWSGVPFPSPTAL